MGAPGVRRRVKWPVTVEIVVPWSDLDAAGHVNNAKYFSYMETARCDAYYQMKGLTPAQAGPAALDIILARASCDFRSPASMGETLQVRVWPTRVGGSSFGLRYELREKSTQRLVAEGESVQVTFDYAKQAKKPVPDDVRAALEAGL